MPQYSYSCPKCNDSFEIYLSLTDYKPQQNCPNCKSLCGRDLCLDCDITPNIPKTVGSLADKNTDKMSADQKAALKEKHYEYRKGPRPELPEGMKYMNER